MSSIFKDFWQEESGVIISAELVIILTIAVLGMIVGLSNLQHALTAEFADLSLAFQHLNQSYCTPSYRGCWKLWGWGGPTSWVAGSCFYDYYDACVGYSYGNGGYGGGYGGGGYGGYGGDIYGSSNYGSSGGCVTGGCAGTGDVSGPGGPGLSPVPDAGSSGGLPAPNP